MILVLAFGAQLCHISCMRVPLSSYTREWENGFCLGFMAWWFDFVHLQSQFIDFEFDTGHKSVFLILSFVACVS